MHLRAPVQRVLTENGKVKGIELPDGVAREYDSVVSSMPLTVMVKRLPEAPAHIKAAAESLRFRNTILVYLNIDAERLFPDQWLYVHAPELKTGRITNFRNWLPTLYGKEKTTILAMEYWCYDEDEMWQWDDARLIAMGKEEIRRTGLIGEAKILDGYVYRIPRCYPVYRRGYKEKLKPIEEYLSAIEGLWVIGRYGAFKYNNQDHSILMGLLAAENIADGAKHNLWEINTDYETYQEASVITKTGLQKK